MGIKSYIYYYLLYPCHHYFSWLLYEVVSILLILQMRIQVRILALSEVVSCSVAAKARAKLLNANGIMEHSCEQRS